MSQDDSFSTPGDNDRTLIRPMPGGRRATGAPPPPSGASAKVAPTPSGAPPVGTGLNPLTGCASPLLIAAGELRNSTVHPDPEGLRSRLVNEVRTFEGCARAKGIPENHVLTARYVLCSLLELMYLCLALGFKGRYAREGAAISWSWSANGSIRPSAPSTATPSGSSPPTGGGSSSNATR